MLIALLILSVPKVYGQDEVVIPADSVAVQINDSLTVDTVEVDKSLTLQQQIDKLLEADLFKHSYVGMMVYDLTADSVVYAYNEQQTLRPASTLKLTTAITALDRLGGSYRYATKLKYRGAIYDASNPSQPERKSNVLVGDLIIEGGMDPRFNTDDMKAFVEALQKEHIDTIYGMVKEDRSFKDTELLGEGWCWDDDNPVLTPVLWNRKDGLADRLLRSITDAHIVVRPMTEMPKDSLGNRFYDSQQNVMSTFSVRYHTIDQILLKMMKDSDNLYAESMFYQVAADVVKHKKPGRAKDAVSAEEALIKKVGMKPSDYRIVDGSGLSLYNYQSAELQIKLLRYAFKNTNIYEYLYPSLPIAGVDGTLRKRMRRTKAEGNVHAKTGTVEGVSSLSGYLTAPNGNIYCFSIINQGTLKSAPAKSFQDKVCALLCTY